MSSQANSMSESVVANTPTRIESSMPHRILIVVGLAIGAVLGFGGGFLPAGPPQNIAHALSSLALIMGWTLFAAWFARRWHPLVVVGFALLALAESINLSGLFLSAGAPTFPADYAFAAGVALYAVALPLTSVPPAFPLWTRIVGTLAALPFAAHALLWLLGRSPDPSGPLATIGYILLIITIVGWIITILRTAPSSQR
ncbi:MAG TPA: hypothetical protein VFN02_14120 [Ktedonobacteraceae bacterium]|nr:hypothetical protein [Ktedonobacteraceae bacterium]